MCVINYIQIEFCKLLSYLEMKKRIFKNTPNIFEMHDNFIIIIIRQAVIGLWMVI